MGLMGGRSDMLYFGNMGGGVLLFGNMPAMEPAMAICAQRHD